MALGPGSIAFTGFNADGHDNLAFVVLEDIAAGTVINFNDNAYLSGAFKTGESAWSWTASSDIAAGTVVTMDNLAAGLISTSNLGTITWIDETARGLDTGAEVVYAYIGDATAPTFLTAISNDTIGRTTTGSFSAAGLTNGTNAIGFATSNSSTLNYDIVAYSGPRETGETLDNLRKFLFDKAYWSTQNTDGDDSADGVGPDVPFDTTSLSIDPDAQQVRFSSDSLLVTHVEGNSGTTTYTFVVERTNGTTGEVHFTGTFSNSTPHVTGRGITNAADFAGGVYPASTFTGTIPDGATSATITVSIASDTVYEAGAEENFSLRLTSATNDAATAYVNQDKEAPENVAIGVIVNDDTQQVIGFAANSLTVLAAEGDGGTTTVTFTVERTGNGGTVGDVAFSGSFAAGTTNAGDFGGAFPTGFSGVIPDGQSSATFTVTFAGDTTTEGHERFTLTLTSATNPAAQNIALASSQGRTTTAYILNDDGPNVVHSGETVQTVGLTGQASLTIEQGGTVGGIAVSGEDFDVTIANAGTMTSFTTADSKGDGKLTVDNQATGVMTSMNIPVFNGPDSVDVVFNNAGRVQTVGGGDSYSTFVLNNLAGGVIDNGTLKTNAVEVLGDTTINNAGKIIARSNDGPREGIEYKGTGVVLNNLAGGWIEGGHHAFTGAGIMTVVNEEGGTMIGNNGSAVNIDGQTAAGQAHTIINRGVMQGKSANSIDSDGDAIDTDGSANVENWGTVEGLGHSGSHNGGLNVSEGIAIGGGSITNHEGGSIYGYGRGITIDNSDEGGAFAAVSIVNAGTIQGDGNLPMRYRGAAGAEFVVADDYAPLMVGAEAVNIVGDWADTLTNDATGKIIGGVKMGGGDDVLTNYGMMIATGGSAVNLGDGSDTLHIHAGSSITGLIDGGAGVDLISYAGAGGVAIDLGAGTVMRGAVTESVVNFENVTGSQSDDVITGSSVSNVLHGGAGEDKIDGAAGNDILAGDAGDDLLEGGDGNDTIDGGADDDVIYGDAGNDTLIGGLGDDVIKGNAGDDIFVVTSAADGRDSYDGGEGIDTLDFSALSTAVNLTLKDDVTTYATDKIENIENVTGGSAADKLTGNTFDNVLSGGGGDDALKGGAGDDTLHGGEGNDALDGGAGNDQLSGGAGADDLVGGAGDDALAGGLGDDTLNGGAGNDVLEGGAGNDILTGGAGLDQFWFDADSLGSVDTITDFKVTGAQQDQLVFSTEMFQNFSGDDAFDLIGSGFLRAVSGGGTTELQIDVDGGGDDFVTLATMSGSFTNGTIADHVVLVNHDLFL